jgi:hypothetical protein
MALVKKDVVFQIPESNFVDIEDANEVFFNQNQIEEKRIAALEFVINNCAMSDVLKTLMRLVGTENDIKHHIYIDLVFSNFINNKKNDEDFDVMLKMLKSTNVYLRNMVIKYLQENGVDARLFIKKLMENPDKDLRIFSINILGDVRFEESVEMLRYFIAQEDDINAMMTAIDYLGEIGTENDIELLEAVKKEHNDNPYVTFGADVAIERLRGCH